MFRDWDNYYLLLGGASGSLIGLLFIVMTLTAGRDREQTLRAMNVYTTPIVFHLGVVLVLSAMAMAPGVGAGAVALAAGAAALAGVVYCISICVRMRHLQLSEPLHWSDFWCYGVAPLVVYLGLLLAAIIEGWEPLLQAWGMAVTLMLLLLVSIRNAWDLITWIAPQAKPPG